MTLRYPAGTFPFDHVIQLHDKKKTFEFDVMEARIKKWFRGYITHEVQPYAEFSQGLFDSIGSEVLVEFKNVRDGKNIRYSDIEQTISHIQAWRRVIELDKPCLIMEDFVECESNNILLDLKALNSDGMKERDWELFWFHRVPMFSEEFEGQAGWHSEVVFPNYSWEATCYALTPAGARKLLDGEPWNHIMRVDDYLSFMMAAGFENPDIQAAYPNIKFLHALALKPSHKLFSWTPAQNEVESPEFFRRNKNPNGEQIAVTTVLGSKITNNNLKLRESMNFNSWPKLTNLSDGSTLDLDTKTNELFYLANRIKEFGQHEVSPEHIMVYVAGYRSLFVDTPHNVVRRWMDYYDDQNKVLFAVDERRNRMNADCYIGRVKNIIKMFDAMVKGGLKKDMFELDDRRRIFQDVDCEYDKKFVDPTFGRPHNQKEQLFPQILFSSGNGGLQRLIDIGDACMNSHSQNLPITK